MNLDANHPNYYSSTDLRSRRRQRRTVKQGMLSFLAIVLLGCTIGAVLSMHAILVKPTLASPLAQDISDDSVLQPPQAYAADTATLEDTVENALQGTTGTYGVVVKNLKTGEMYESNSHQIFESASLYKLWIMATVYQQIEEGRLTLDTPLQKDVPVLNDEFNIASEEAEMTQGTISYSVQDALTKMITISDNYAALLLSDKIGLSNVRLFLQTHGLNESSVGGANGLPTTTAYDIALYFQKLYSGELGNAASTQAMLTLLKQQELNEKIPLLLPQKTVIAHKTGELDQYSHDAGIVYAPEGPYIIAVLSESTDTLGANQRIADMSKAIYTYFLHATSSD